MAKINLKSWRGIGKQLEKVFDDEPILTWIQARIASPAPPLGPLIGERGINIAQFIKEFNNKTANYKKGIPLECRIFINSDRTYKLEIYNPPIHYYLLQASGVEREAHYPKEEIAGKVTVKHVYEIAKIKQQDYMFESMPIKQIFLHIVEEARAMGLQVVHRLDEKDYNEFLQERAKIVERQLKEMEEAKQAKMLRTVVTK